MFVLDPYDYMLTADDFDQLAAEKVRLAESALREYEGIPGMKEVCRDVPGMVSEHNNHIKQYIFPGPDT